MIVLISEHYALWQRSFTFHRNLASEHYTVLHLVYKNILQSSCKVLLHLQYKNCLRTDIFKYSGFQIIIPCHFFHTGTSVFEPFYAWRHLPNFQSQLISVLSPFLPNPWLDLTGDRLEKQNRRTELAICTHQSNTVCCTINTSEPLY